MATIKMEIISDVHVSSAPVPQRMGYTAREIMSAPYVYAPYIPLFATPTLHTGDIINHEVELEVKIYPIKNYKDLYSDRRNRFRILDL